jgi:hypothetical protein
MTTLFFATNRRIEEQGYTKENKKQEEICPQGNFLAKQPRKESVTNKALNRVSVERDPQC